MLGHISTAYTAKTSRDLALSTRFDFNVYSFESEWTMGAEYWLRRKPHFDEEESSAEEPLKEMSLKPPVYHPEAHQDVQGVLKARVSTNNVCSSLKFSFSEK
jgi:distribution and morphology protein 10